MLKAFLNYLLKFLPLLTDNSNKKEIGGRIIKWFMKQITRFLQFFKKKVNFSDLSADKKEKEGCRAYTAALYWAEKLDADQPGEAL
ncbi:MAG: hypothetical protein V1816_08090 [Pseudomonadota bacterium]